MFVFPLVKKLAQNMGTSYSGFGKTPKSKTCKKLNLHLKSLYNNRGNIGCKIQQLDYKETISFSIWWKKKKGFSPLYFTLHWIRYFASFNNLSFKFGYGLSIYKDLIIHGGIQFNNTFSLYHDLSSGFKLYKTFQMKRDWQKHEKAFWNR